MTAGFQAYTDSGFVQIDGESINHSLRLHVTLSTSAAALQVQGSNFGRIYSVVAQLVYLTFQASQPVVAFYAPGSPVALINCVQTSPGNWQALFWSNAQTSFEAYVFDRTDQVPASSSRCGLQVFNSSGVLIADSAIPMLRAITYYSGNVCGIGPGWSNGSAGWPGTTSASYSQSGRTKVATGAVITATAVAGLSSNNTDGSDSSAWVGISAWNHTAGGGVTWNWIVTGYNGAQYYPSYYVGYGSMLNWGGLLIDVSNL